LQGVALAHPGEQPEHEGQSQLRRRGAANASTSAMVQARLTFASPTGLADQIHFLGRVLGSMSRFGPTPA
jgi:hypothetical protein